MRVAGPRGNLEERKNRAIDVVQEDGQLLVTRPTDRAEHRALHGLTRSLVANMVEGVTTGFTKTLEIQGVGYRAQLKGRDLELALGYSHPVPIKAPEGIEFEVPHARRASSSRATRSRSSARSPRSSASSARRSPTRARASATRASTWPERSVSGHDRFSPLPREAPQAPPPRPREGARHGRAAADLRVPLQPRAVRPAHRRRRGPHAGLGPVDRGRPALAQADGAGHARPASCWPSARRRPASSPPCSTAAATSTTAVSRPWPRAPARAA